MFPRPHPLSQGPASDSPCQCPVASIGQSQCWLLARGVCVFYASSGGGSIGFLSASCLLGSVATMCTYALVFLPSTSWLPMRLISPVDNQMSFHLQAISHSIHLCNKAAQFLITVPIPEGLGKPISRILPHLPNPPAACPQRKKLRQKTTSVPAADRAQVCLRTGRKVPKDGPLCPEILQPGVGVGLRKSTQDVVTTDMASILTPGLGQL